MKIMSKKMEDMKILVRLLIKSIDPTIQLGPMIPNKNFDAKGSTRMVKIIFMCTPNFIFAQIMIKGFLQDHKEKNC